MTAMPDPSPWSPPGAVQSLCIAGQTVAQYNAGDDVPVQSSRRAYLHPVQTLGGVTLTELHPADHTHHLGVSFAIADVSGTSYWGGNTFVAGAGSQPLDNHGRQCRLSCTRLGDAFLEEIAWYDKDGAQQLLESRALRGGSLAAIDGWALSFSSILTASTDVMIGSPATNGRPGAGYGGIFWRLPAADATQVFSEAGHGERAVHESASRWLVINQRHGERHTSLVLSQPVTQARSWFVRVAEYVGAGPMLAPSFTVRLREGAALHAALTGVLLDRWVSDETDAAAIAAAATVGARAGISEGIGA